MSGKQALLVKPMAFMNKSGESVAALAKFYKVRVHLENCGVQKAEALELNDLPAWPLYPCCDDTPPHLAFLSLHPGTLCSTWSRCHQHKCW